MIKLYDGEVFTFDISDYNRWEILSQFEEIKKVMYFLVYDGDKLLKAMSIFDIVYEREVTPGTVQPGEHIFEEAEDYFKRNGNYEYSGLPVVDRGGEVPVFVNMA